MSVKNDKDFLYLIWKDPTTRQQYVIGEMSKNGGYAFKYSNDINEAIVAGFKPLVSFSNLTKTYQNETLFSVFSSRLPDMKRKDITAILKKYDLPVYDDYQLLKRSGAKLPIDDLEFIDPILEDESPIDKKFYVAGPRHYLGCDGEDCEKAVDINIGDSLTLKPEPENEYDSNAIKLVDKNGNHIGYIPRYYNQGVLSRLNNKSNVTCQVVEYNKENHCSDCIKVHLLITK